MSRILYEKPASGYATVSIGSPASVITLLVCPKNYRRADFDFGKPTPCPFK